MKRGIPSCSSLISDIPMHSSSDQHIKIKNSWIQISEYRIYLDSNLNFKCHIKQIKSDKLKVKFNLTSDLSENLCPPKQPKCICTLWSSPIWLIASQAGSRPTTSLWNPFSLCTNTSVWQKNKSLPSLHHSVQIQLSWENLIRFTNITLTYKILHGMAPPPLSDLIRVRPNTNRVTRGASRGDCIIPQKKTAFSQSAFSVRASKEWNSIPTTIREINSYGLFRSHLKIWLFNNQTCQL